jgi:hypothetical protein
MKNIFSEFETQVQNDIEAWVMMNDYGFACKEDAAAAYWNWMLN